MKKFLVLTAGLAMSSSTYAGLAIGDTVTLSRTGSVGGGGIQFNFDSSLAAGASAVSLGSSGLATLSRFDVISVNSSSSGGELVAFCVEIAEAFPDDPIAYNVVDPTGVPEENPPGNMSSAMSQVMQDLYARYYGDVVDTGNDGSWNDAASEIAAFQLVVWEISHENFSDRDDTSTILNELSLSLGAFQADSNSNASIGLIAGQMIAQLGSGGLISYSALLGGSNPTNQDLLIVVPSPAIAGLAGLGLVGMRRRRR